ncbi:MAG: hypothetical protein JWQ75_2481 [Pseudarthrobacter sp.]|nr:hypothetical protein [Pseudarthrobacter sp.]
MQDPHRFRCLDSDNPGEHQGTHGQPNQQAPDR